MFNINKIFKNINRHSWLYVIFGYIIISLLFNYNFLWKELFFDRSKNLQVFGEVLGVEWALEKFYQALISGHNPFGSTISMLYPLEVNVGLFDSGYGLFFPFLRPFLSTHQSLSILVALSLIMANIGMYLLLRKLNFDKLLSFVIGAAFGYMTFLMVRGGHLSYWCFFVFPWFYYFCVSFLLSKNNIKKALFSIGIAVFFALTLFLNMYFFVILLISIFTLICYFLFFKTKTFFHQVISDWKYYIFTGFLTFILLIPWLKGLYELSMFDQTPETKGWGGAIQFSSDLFNYFLPSQYGYLVTKFPILLAPINLFMKLYRADARAIFENYTYVGIIILFSYLAYLFLLKKKKFRIHNEKLMPFLVASLVILVLTLGPFLHIFGHWRIPVDDDIRIVIPLPYILLHYIPFLQNVRVPGRLIPGFIFFAYIVCAYIINYLLINKTNKTKIIVFIFLIIIFFVDHRYDDKEIDFLPKQIIANKIFNTIKEDKVFATVLEVPFTVRDGFTYFGSVNSIQMIIGSAIHGKPFLGGYIGRIPDYKKYYYQKDPFLGYIGRKIDEGIQNNGIIDKEDLINWQKIDIQNSKKTIDFLDIKYIVNNDDVPLAASLAATYKDLGYEKTIVEDKYSLWVRKLYHDDYISIDMEDPSSQLFLGFGWHDREDNFRWSDRKASVMFKINQPRKLILNFEAAAFHKGQPVTIYLNKRKIAKINISTNMKKYAVPIDNEFEKGTNKVYFIFDKYYRPSDTMSGSLDQRRLSGKFEKIWLSNQ